jgi:hypothetical protein
MEPRTSDQPEEGDMAPIGKPKRRIRIEPLPTPREAPKPVREPSTPRPKRREKVPA